MHSQLLYGAGMNRMVGVAEQKLKQLEIIDRKHNRLSKDRLFLTRVEDEHKLCKIEAQTYHITMFEEKFSLSDEPLYIISSESIVNTPVYEEKRPLLGGEKTTGNNGGTTNDDTAYDDFYDEKSPADQQERDSLAQVNTTDNVSIEYSGNSSSMTQSSPDVPRESKSTVSSQSLTSPAEPEAHARANRALSQPALHHTQTHLAMKSEGHHLLFQAQALSLPLTQRQPVIRVAPYNYMIVTMQRTYGVIVDKHSTTNAAIDAFEEYLHRHAVFRIAAAPMLINDMMKNPDDIAVYTQKTADGIKSGTIAVADVIVRGSVYLGTHTYVLVL